MIVIDFYATDTRPLSHSPGLESTLWSITLLSAARKMMRESASGYYNIDESFPVHQQFVRQRRVGEGGGGGRQYRNCRLKDGKQSQSHSFTVTLLCEFIY